MHIYIPGCLAVLFFTCAAARADFQNGQYANLALGDLAPSQSFASPSGVAVDPETHKVFVSDEDKNRVLRFTSVEALKNGGLAEAVLGQPDFNTTHADTTASGMRGPKGLAMGGDGRLWVADQFNHRILRFDHAATLASGSPADGILGQPAFNQHASVGGPSGMYLPRSVAVDAGGRLWVADAGNSRVLRFDAAAAKAPGAAADGVLGQPDLFETTGATSASRCKAPAAVAVDSASGNLWVGDTLNSRVLLFTNPAGKPNGAAADHVLGQVDFTTGTAALTANRMNTCRGLAAAGGVLWVSDTYNNRVLRFDNAAAKSNGASANGVLGQALFTTGSGPAGPAHLNYPEGLALDGGQLWAVDVNFQRVLRYQAAATKPSGSNADGVMGQRTMDTSYSGTQAHLLAEYPHGIAVDPVSAKVFVCDTNNNRVLRFASGSALVSGASAELAFGQPDLTSSNAGSGDHVLNGPMGVAIDHLGHLWIADSGNNRVLRIANAATESSGLLSGAVAIGQTNIYNSDPASGPAGMNNPTGLAVESTFSRTLQTWSTKRLWVADNNNSRVLRFDAPLSNTDGTAAAGVLGQPGFDSVNVSSASNGMHFPGGVAVDGNGRLWVADSANHRVLRFDSAATKPVGAAANGLLLQAVFGAVNEYGPTASLGKYPMGVCVSPQGRLFVSEFGGDRTVWFNDAASRPNGSPADGVLGSYSFDTPGTTAPRAWNDLLGATACCLDDAGRLWVTDGGNARVLRFAPALDSSISSAVLNPQQKLTLTMSALVGESFELHSSPDLLDWSTTEATFRAVIGFPYGVLSWTAPAAASGKRFYRLQAP